MFSVIVDRYLFVWHTIADVIFVIEHRFVVIYLDKCSPEVKYSFLYFICSLRSQGDRLEKTKNNNKKKLMILKIL